MALGTAVMAGAGPALGAALARAFADAGHPIAMLDIDKARLDTDAAEAGAGTPGPGAEEAIRAEVPHQARVRAATGDGDVAAEDPRELDGEQADAVGPLDQRLLVGLQRRVVGHLLPCGQRRQRQRVLVRPGGPDGHELAGLLLAGRPGYGQCVSRARRPGPGRDPEISASPPVTGGARP